MVPYNYAVGIYSEGLFSIIPKYDINICQISAKDMIISLLSIGYTFHAYIENNIPIFHCL